MEKPIFEHNDLYDLEIERLHVKKFFDEELRALCREKIFDLDVEYAYSEEPVPFAEISALEFKPIKVGEVWAKKNFACAWFHLTGKLPEGLSRENLRLDFCNDGEGLLVDKNGHAVKNFTTGSSVFGISYITEKRYYPLDGIVGEDGVIDLYIDGASNGLQGDFLKDTALLSAAIVRENPEICSLFYDFDVLLEHSWHEPFTNPNRVKIIRGLRKAMNLFIYDAPNACARSKEIMKKLFALEGNDRTQVTAVGHAHLDLAWLWPLRESYRKAKRTFANAVYLMKKYPDFRFVVSQPQQLEWMKEMDPVLYEELRELAKTGQLEPVGGGWVENDTNIPCGESLVRQELYGQKFWQEEFGHYVNLRWLPDTFGYSACMPQLLRQAAQDSFMTIKLSWSNRTKFPYHTFHWQGIDGTDVLVHMPPEGNYNSTAGPQGLKAAQMCLRPNEYKDSYLMVYGIGDGGGGPSVNMVERILREENIPYLAKVKMGSAHEFFDSLKEKDLPIYAGEMYLEKHRATYTSQANNKNYNRQIEEKLLAIETLSSCLGESLEKTEIDRIWKEVLLYQFHDILPGSSIQRVYDETDEGYAKLFEKVEGLANGFGVSYEAKEDSALINTTGGEISKILPCGEKYLYYKGADSLVLPKVYSEGKALKGLERFETEYYSVIFDTDGSFKEIRLKDGRVAATNANKLRVFIDRGDSWDFIDDYRDQPARYMELKDTCARDFGDLVEIKQNYTYKNSSLLQTIVLHKAEPIIRISHDVRWVDDGYMVRAEFLPAAWSDTAHSDIQFGYLDRPTTDETEHDAAQFEICCQKWFDVSSETQGLAVLNDARSGYMAKNREISVNLFRSTPYPCKEREHIAYSYAVYPHAGGFDPIAADDLAEAYSARYLFGDKRIELPHTDSKQVILSAFKPAYNGDGYILRLFERSGKAARVNLTLPKGFALAGEVDLLEDGGAAVSTALEFKPFQIRSFKVVKA